MVASSKQGHPVQNRWSTDFGPLNGKFRQVLGLSDVHGHLNLSPETKRTYSILQQGKSYQSVRSPDHVGRVPNRKACEELARARGLGPLQMRFCASRADGTGLSRPSESMSQHNLLLSCSSYVL